MNRILSFALVVAAVVVVAARFSGFSIAASEEARVIPAPIVDEKGPKANSEVAVLAAGCFWGVQGVFQHVKGVTNAVSGYAGGDRKTAEYRAVSSGRTGHAESVQVTFDPRQVTFGQLLHIYFSVAHDPTQLNKQGPDVGPQYRSAIFAASAEQAEVARAYIAQLDQAKVFDRPIVTKIQMDQAFYPAEDYHQDFLTLNPTYPYIVFNDLPKIEALKRFFPASYRPQPVLVGQGR